MKNTTLKEFFDWYKGWYKPIESKMNIIFSVPNELHLQEFRMLMVEENVVVLELFEKIDQGIDAKPYMQQICDKADELGVAIYLEPMPRYKYFRDNIEKRKKVGKEYLKEYYARFGFEPTTDKRFMKRTPKMNNRIDDMIDAGIVQLEMYDTTPQHAAEYGLTAIRPLYLKNLCVDKEYRLKKVGKSVLEYVEDYARKNGNDVIFGHVASRAEFTKDGRQTTFCDVEMIKYWLYDNGYAINNDNNDFHKIVEQFAKGGKFHLGGDMTKHLAPNGKPSNLTHEQWHLVRTPKFKQWFGDWENDPKNASKVVDENGEPLVVYHGTKKEFSVFGTEEKIKFYLPEYRHLYEWKKNTNYFHRNIEYAKVFGSKYGGYENPYFLNIRNLIEVETHDDIEDIGYWENIYNYYTKEMNGDGIYSNDGQFATLSSPTQIKLADGSNTTFDGSNPDIRFELGGIYHGSPHKFEKFSTEYMGSGEGAQAFGWGLYFTDLAGIARNYGNVGQNRVTLNGKKIFELPEIENLLASGDDSWAYVSSKSSLKNRLNELVQERVGILDDWDNQKKYYSKYGDISLKEEIEEAKWLISQLPNMVEEKNRNLYKVTLHKGKTPDQYTWLEWDKIPSKRQIQIILDGLQRDDFYKKRIEEYRYDYKKIKDAEYLGYAGKDIYQSLSAILGGDKEASLFLLRAGIDGIKYPAESIARGATSDTARGFNYVVFDADAVTIEGVEQFAKGGQVKNLITRFSQLDW